MTSSRAALCLMTLALLWAAGVNAQKVNRVSTNRKQQVAFLNFKDNGKFLAATVGEQIEVSLGEMAQCDPLVSSFAVQLESVAVGWPPTPGLAAYTYIFHAASAGEALVRIPITDCSNPDLPGGATFGVTIRVEKSADELSTPYAARIRDQVNSPPWTGGWRIVLSNNLRQSFTPSQPKLTGVELEFVAGNPGPTNSEVTVNLLNASGDILSVVSKKVPVEDCGHVLFVFPKGGWHVSPGAVYQIEVHGDGVFGWKYAGGGYSRGVGTFKGKLLSQGQQSSFLFRTFGAN